MAGMSGLGSLLSDLAYFSVLPGTGYSLGIRDSWVWGGGIAKK